MEAHRTRAVLAVALLLAVLLGGCSKTQGILPLRQESGEAAEVIRNYREAMERQRAHAEHEAERMRSQKRSLEELLEEGDQLRDSGNYGPALFSYLRAHTQSREDDVPRLRIGFLHLREDPARAEAIFRKVLAGASDSLIAWTGLALAQMAQARSSEARSSLERAIALDPQASVSRSLLGVLHDRDGNHVRAQEQYQRALAVEPDDHVILNNLGVSYLLSERFDLAVEVLRRASFAEPRNPVLRNNLGLALGLEGRYEAALDAFRAAGSEWAAQNNLGWVYYLNGDYADAISCFEKALDAEGDDLLVVLGNIDRARSALESAPRGYVSPQRRQSAAPPRHQPPRRERRWAEDQISVAELRAAMESEEPARPTPRAERVDAARVTPRLDAARPAPSAQRAEAAWIAPRAERVEAARTAPGLGRVEAAGIAPLPELETAQGEAAPSGDEGPGFDDDFDDAGEIEFDWEDDFGWVDGEDEPTA